MIYELDFYSVIYINLFTDTETGSNSDKHFLN